MGEGFDKLVLSEAKDLEGLSRTVCNRAQSETLELFNPLPPVRIRHLGQRAVRVAVVQQRTIDCPLRLNQKILMSHRFV